MVRALGWLAAASLAAGLVMAFGVAPREVTQGNVQRIMYVHVSLILASYLAFVVLALASLVYLVRRAEAADRVAHASGEVGVMFVGLGIVTGSIWGKPTWGTWWTWDARLTSVAILFVMYVGYLLLRGTLDEPESAARAAAPRPPPRRRGRPGRAAARAAPPPPPPFPRALLPPPFPPFRGVVWWSY